MAFTQIAGVAPNYRDYKNWWLKAYEPGTTTPKLMSDNDTGSPTSAKYELNKDGFIISSGGTLIIPHIDGDYDLWLFPTAAEADANDTTNAERLADDLENYLTNTSLGNSIGGFVSYEFNTVTDAQNGLTIGSQVVTLKVGDVIRIKERSSALFDVISGTGTANGLDVIAHATLNISFSLRIIEKVRLIELGATIGDATSELSRANELSESLALPIDLDSLVISTTTGISLDVAKQRLIGDGARLTFAPTGTLTLLTITNSEPDVNKRGILAASNTIEGVSFFGPGKNDAGNCRFCVINDSVDNSIWGVSFSNGGYFGFPRGLDTVNGAFMINYINFHGISNGVNLNFVSATNAGERFTATGCTFTNSNVILTQSNPNASSYFNSCSLDYTPRMMTVTAGDVSINQSHIESDIGTDNWFVASGANASIRVSDSAIVLNNTEEDLANSPFNSLSSVTMGGIYIIDCDLWTNSTHTVDVLVDGDGVSVVNGVTYFENSRKPALSRYSTDLAYGDFENANYANDWVFSGTIPPTRVAGPAYEGTYSLKFEQNGGTQSVAELIRECKPGQIVTGHFYYQTNVAAASAGFLVEVEYIDEADGVISNFVRINQTADVSTWTLFEFATQVKAPPGTVKYKLKFSLYDALGPTAGLAYIDDVICQAA